jgi:hypothetical protein
LTTDNSLEVDEIKGEREREEEEEEVRERYAGRIVVGSSRHI